MADDNGLIADIEAAMVAKAAALKLSGFDVFRATGHWKWQIKTQADWDGKHPFFFVRYLGTVKTTYVGDATLISTMQFEAGIGTFNTTKGGARIGTGVSSRAVLGISRIRDLVIAAIHGQVLSTTGGNIEEVEYAGDRMVLDDPNYADLYIKFNVDVVGV